MILLSLIGEQPIPNLLPLWQEPGRYTATRFAVTEKTRPIAERLAEVIRSDPQLGNVMVLQPLLLRAYDMGFSRARLNAALAEHLLHDESVCLNLTGGTKIMSLAALQAAYGTGVPLLYVSTQTGEMIHYHSDGSEQGREAIDVHISVQQYFAAHGIEASLHPAFHDGRPVETPREGDELERIVFEQARASGFFDDVQRNVYIRTFGCSQPVRNELDVVVTRGGKLTVCSCKSGKNLTNKDLYELSSLSRRELAGIYCGKVLVSALDEVPAAIKDRARASGVRLLYGRRIDQAAETLREALT